MTADSSVCLIPAGSARVELRVVNSRFIGSAAPAATVENAKAFIAAVRAEMPDATHHVYAYVIGHGSSTIKGMSDDGEPAGTAGRPVLSVVQGSGLGDVVVVVTRYFGGTRLGIGGLVHAYGDAAKATLAALPRTEKIARRSLRVTIPYAAYEPVQRLVVVHRGTITHTEFAADVALDLSVPEAHVTALIDALRDVTKGRMTVTTMVLR
ncbi:MAG: YigZ family protein [Roseiflexus castenholzii]|uniref:YigZ family protein n=1 Tax=Roseiflexus castenholzii TaxID=120962 RepID=UPI000CB7765C|nr:MAG: YigZ family protein [Roseiflexus castenholzii]